jgi:hypothetical protein
VLTLVRYLALGLLSIGAAFIYVLVVIQFMDLARREAALGFANAATLDRVVPLIGIPAFAAVLGAVSFWVSGRKIYVGVIVAAICMIFVGLVALVLSVPVVPIG